MTFDSDPPPERRRLSSPEEPHIPLGYFCSINVATLVYGALTLFINLRPRGPGDESLVDWFPIQFFAAAFLAACFWFSAFFAAMLPFAGTYIAARRLRINSVFYYGGCGAIIGLGLTPLATFLAGYLDSWDAPVRTPFESWTLAAPKFAFCGVCGALVFWYKAGRHLNRSSPE